jgi:hypothetical protein
VILAADFSDLLTEATAQVSAATVMVGAASWVVVRYRRTLGKRRDLRRKLSRLASTVRVEYIEGLLGPSTFRSALDEQQTEDLFVTDYATVQTISAADGTVLVLAVTVTDVRLKPRFWLGLPGSWPTEEVVLGHTKFGDLTITPQIRTSFRGARRFSYRETYYLGNPGGYQTYVLLHVDAGAGIVGGFEWLFGPDGFEIDQGSLMEPLSTDPEIERFRADTVINTFAVTSPHLSEEDLKGLQLGADRDVVRLLPVSSFRRWQANRQTRRWLRRPDQHSEPKSAGNLK